MNNSQLMEGGDRIAHVGDHMRCRNLAHAAGLCHARGKRCPIDVLADNNHLVRQARQVLAANRREAREDLGVRNIALYALAHQRPLAQVLRARPAHNLGRAGLPACEHALHAVGLVLLERSHELRICGRVH